MARGCRARSSATRASSAAASGWRPSTSGTEVVAVAITEDISAWRAVASGRRRLRRRSPIAGGAGPFEGPELTRDEAQLAQARRRHHGDGVLVGEAGVAQAVVLVRRRRVAAPDGGVQAVEGQVAERVGAHELADVLHRLRRGDELFARRG